MRAEAQLVHVTPFTFVASALGVVVLQLDVHQQFQHPRRPLKHQRALLGAVLQTDLQVHFHLEFREDHTVQLVDGESLSGLQRLVVGGGSQLLEELAVGVTVAADHPRKAGGLVFDFEEATERTHVSHSIDFDVVDTLLNVHMDLEEGAHDQMQLGVLLRLGPAVVFEDILHFSDHNLLLHSHCHIAAGFVSESLEEFTFVIGVEQEYVGRAFVHNAHRHLDEIAPSAPFANLLVFHCLLEGLVFGEELLQLLAHLDDLVVIVHASTSIRENFILDLADEQFELDAYRAGQRQTNVHQRVL